MNLLELRVSNYQKVSAVRIRPDGNIVKIVGKNDQGKTSILRSIWTLLVGKAASPPQVIRLGEEECKLYGDFGSMKVTRIFTKADGDDVTMSLNVTNGDGSPVRKRPQALLDSLIGAYSFDPLAFARAPAKTQYDTLKVLVKGFDFDANAEQRQKAFDARTEVNRKAKEARTLAERIQLPPGPCPKAVDVSAKLTELEEANRHNASIIPERQRRTRCAFDIGTQRRHRDEMFARAAALRAEADKFELQASAIDDDIRQEEKRLAALPPLPTERDTAAIREEIGAAERIKGIRILHENRRKHEDDAERLEGEASTLTGRIEKIDQAKRDAIAAAEMPVPGLGFGDGEILLDGLPFSQAATSIKIKTSAMIGMALNPELRLMTIDEASELDSDALQMIAELAAANDFQVWLARVAEGPDSSGFVIVDGHLAEDSQ